MNNYPPELDNDPVCNVCSLPVSVCNCPECPDCGIAGKISCYVHHSLSGSEHKPRLGIVQVKDGPKLYDMNGLCTHSINQASVYPYWYAEFAKQQIEDRFQKRGLSIAQLKILETNTFSDRDIRLENWRQFDEYV